MAYQFNKHYTREDARALLPHVRLWLKRLVHLRKQTQKSEKQVEELMQPGCDAGGPVVNELLRLLADLREVLLEFHQREIQIKDLERGLLDFPCIMEGKEVFLCW